MSYYRSRPVAPVTPAALATPVAPVSKYSNLPQQIETEAPVVEPEVEVPEVETEVESESYQPIVSFNIPTLIRILELIHEDVPTDDILHYVVEKIIEVGACDNVIGMDDYEEIATVIPTRVMAAQRRGRDGRRI